MTLPKIESLSDAIDLAKHLYDWIEEPDATNFSSDDDE